MKNLFVIVLFCSTAFGMSKRAPAPEMSPTPSPAPTVSAGTVPFPSGVEFKPVEYYTTKAQRAKIAAAAVKVKEVLGSQCFADFMSKRKLMDTDGRTPTQVVEHLRGLKGTVPVKIYYRCMQFNVFKCPAPTSAVAYRQPPSKEINLNGYAFTLDMSDCEWAATMAHEGLGHSMGEYGHSFDWTATRDFSVPYSLGGSVRRNGGDAFTNCCK